MAETTERSKQQQAVIDEQKKLKAIADDKEERRLRNLTDKQLFAEVRRVSKTVKPVDAAFLTVCNILNGGLRNSNDPYLLKAQGRPR